MGISNIATSKPLQETQSPLSEASFKEILKNYTFVGDIELKPTTREIPSKEVFWRYPIKIPQIIFESDPLPQTPSQREQAFPITMGEGRATHHFNRARQLYIAGDFEAARNTLLSSTERFGRNYQYHRRSDFLLGLIFLHIAEKHTNERYKKAESKNAMTFLTNAFKVKIDTPDEFIDPMTPRWLHTMAALFYNYGRYGGAFGLSEQGLNWLRKHGRTDHRIDFRRIFAESFIRNRSYLEAIQEFDVALRSEEITPKEAAKIFTRVGDIYFDLNNFELAEEIYALAMAIDKEFEFVRASQYVFRGESLFWLGQYSESLKMFYYALSASGKEVENISSSLSAVASIRMADAWLAQADRDLIKQKSNELRQETQQLKTLPRGSKERSNLEAQIATNTKTLNQLKTPLVKAETSYHRHLRQFPRDHTADHARIRIACLNLPEYGGENIRHARELLAKLKTGIRYNEFYKPTVDSKPLPPTSPAPQNPPPTNDDKGKANESTTTAESQKPEAPPPADGESKGKETASKDAKPTNALNEMNLKKQEDPNEALPLEPLPKEAIHLAWGCETASVAQHERTPAMLDMVRTFVKLYPESSFFRDLEVPVMETQAKSIYSLFDSDQADATIFFELNRERLFKVVPEDLKPKLFVAYVDQFESSKAEEFWESYMDSKKSLQDDSNAELDLVRIAAFNAEIAITQSQKLRNVEWASGLQNRTWNTKSQDSLRSYLDRILNSQGSEPHYKWMIELLLAWSSKETRQLCNNVLPLLSAVAKNPSEFSYTDQELRDQLQKIMDKSLGELIQFETFCGYSFLEMEQNLLKSDPLTLYNNLSARDYLPINKFTGRLFWNTADWLEKSGHKKEAHALWTKLRDSGASDVVEVEFSRLRLDERRTEVQKLWNN